MKLLTSPNLPKNGSRFVRLGLLSKENQGIGSLFLRDKVKVFVSTLFLDIRAIHIAKFLHFCNIQFQ